jgi:N-acetylneuraminic acid mutarotase
MTTAQPKLLATNTRLVETADLGERFFDYLDGQTKDLIARVYDEPGVFAPALTLTGSGADEFDITGSSLATDGIGGIISAEAAGSYCQDVAFENTAAVVYEVSLHHVTAIKSGTDAVQGNSITGVPEYLSQQDYVGEMGSPDSVSLVGDDIEFVVDGLCEAGVSHDGRFALVYLNTPVTTDPAVAVQIVEIAWSGAQNKATIVSDKLGQPVASTTPSDYTVVVLGPTVRRNSSKVGESGYVVLGSVTGAGAGLEPSTFSTSAQPLINVSLSDINQAFASFAALRGTTIGGAGHKAPISAALWGAGSAVWGSLIFSFGGLTSPTSQAGPTTAVYAYDTEVDSWSTLAPVPDAYSALCAAVTVDDAIYVIGGHDGGDDVSPTVRVYDPLLDSWSTATDMPVGRAGGALSRVGDFLYYVGGQADIGGAGVSTCYRYSVAGDSWSGIADLPTPKARVNLVAYGGKLYALGGSSSDGAAASGIDATCYVYDPSDDSWSSVTSHPTTAYGIDYGGTYMAACFEHNGVIHLLNGGGADTTIAGLHRAYNVLGDLWSELPMPKAPYTFGSVFGAIDGLVYMFGGRVRRMGVSQNATAIDHGFAVSVESVASSPSVGITTNVGTNPTTDAGTASASVVSMQEQRTRFGMCELAGGVLICGGTDGSSTELESSEMYWPETQISLQLPDMGFTKFDHGVVSHGDYAYVFTGRSVAPAGALDVGILRYDMHANTWTDTGQNGHAVSRYSTAKVDTVVLFIGGEDVGGTTQSVVHGFDLTTGKMLNSGAAIGTTGISFKGAGDGRAFGSDVYIAGPDSSMRAFRVWAVGDTSGAGSIVTVDGPSITSGSGQMPSAVWDGLMYFYNPTEQEVWRFDPVSRETEIVATGVTQVFGARAIVRQGRMYIFGGALAPFGTSGTSGAHVIEINAATVEGSIKPSNFDTKLTAPSVGFKAGQTYGAVVHDAYSSADLIRLSAESGL